AVVGTAGLRDGGVRAVPRLLVGAQRAFAQVLAGFRDLPARVGARSRGEDHAEGSAHGRAEEQTGDETAAGLVVTGVEVLHGRVRLSSGDTRDVRGAVGRRSGGWAGREGP